MFKRFFASKRSRGRPLESLLVKNSPVVNRTHLKHRLIREGYLKNKCEWCGIGATWRGKPMTLEMDHINGDNRDNRLDNLRILCLHCHSQTPTFRRPKRKPVRKKKATNWCYVLTVGSIATSCITTAVYYFYA